MKRKNNYQDIYEKLRAEADAPLPDALSPKAIEKLTADTQPLPQPKRVTRYLAVAAVFLFVVLAGSVGWRFLGGVPTVEHVEPPQKGQVVLTEEKSDEYLRSANSYAEIESFFLERWQEYRSNYRFSWFSTRKDSNLGIPEAALGDTADSAINGGMSGSAPEEGAATGTSSAAHGETNTQVAGIDEADILKNDGSYLYIARTIGADTSFVDIIDIRDPKNLHSASRITLPCETEDGGFQDLRELYISGDRLVVLSSVYAPEQTGNNSRAMPCYAYSYGAQKSMVQVYDVTDRTAPKLCFAYAVDGSLLSSRMNGSVLLLMTNYNVPIYKDKTDLKNACVPCYYTDTQKLRFPLEAVKLIDGVETNTYLTVSLLDVQKDSADPKVKAVLGGGSDVYCSADTLLVAHAEYADTVGGTWNSVADIAMPATTTRLFAFDLTDRILYKGSACVEGSVLNQFSMDAYNGYYRIATTDAKGCRITVLDQNLETVGTLTNLAKGESIYAVRFMGDTAYMVTFYQTDPLFVIDLHDPAHPAAVGELKIPGFSNYLHPYSDTLLIGIGADGTESGATPHLKVSLFDVSDKQNPKEISKIVYSKAAYSGSTAQYDHRAYLSIRETGEFAIPVSESNNMGRTSKHISLLTVEDGKLRIVQNYDLTPSDSNDDILRATYAGDVLFTLSQRQLSAFDRASGERLDALYYDVASNTKIYS